AVGISSAGVGVGLLVLVPAWQFLATEHGWRTAMLAQALLVLPLAVLNLALQRRPPRVSARGATRPGVAGWRARSGREWTLALALRAAPFWWLFLALFAGEFAQQLVSIHQIAYLTDAGRAPLEAAFAAGLLGAAAFPGKIFWGFFADRFGRGLAYGLGYAVL